MYCFAKSLANRSSVQYVLGKHSNNIPYPIVLLHLPLTFPMICVLGQKLESLSYLRPFISVFVSSKPAKKMFRLSMRVPQIYLCNNICEVRKMPFIWFLLHVYHTQIGGQIVYLGSSQISHTPKKFHKGSGE